VTVPGMVNAREVEENVSAFESGLSRSDVESIAAAGEIDPALLGGPDFLTAWPPTRRPSPRHLALEGEVARSAGEGAYERINAPSQ